MTAMTKTRKAIDSLKGALEVFSSSNRYGFLKALQVGRLIGEEESLGPVSDLTCEKLVETGAIGVATRFKLSATQVERLAELITALGNGAAPGTPSVQVQTLSEISLQAPSLPQAERMYNSAQAEIELRQRIDEVRAHPGFAQARSTPLGRFWDKEWASAPFEEALTLGQLADMDLAVLLKKRTTSSSRAHLVTQALERALAALSSGRAGGLQALPTVSAPVRKVAHVAPAAGGVHAWLSHESDTAEDEDPAALALAERFLEAVSAPGAAAGSLCETMATIPSMLSRLEFLSLHRDEPLSPRVATQLSKWLKDHASAACVALMREALAAPGSRLSFLARIISEDGRYSAFSGSAATVLARALKAEQIRHEGVVCRGVWSLNPGLVSLVISEGKRRKGKDVERTVRELCPALDPFLQSWICEVVGPATPRKAKRKGK